jgi:chemotaxis protein histidine kinase CheA
VIEQLGRLRLPLGVSLLQRDLLLLLDSVFRNSEEGRESGASDSGRLPATVAVVERNFMSLSRSFEKFPEGQVFNRLLHELPFGSLRSRFDPMINDIARTLGKAVVVQWSGTQLLIDRRKMGILQEALLHLLRNSLDHGLETKSARVLAGKPESGRIDIVATWDDSKSDRCLVIRVSDDGVGVNLDRVLTKAKGLGLISEREVNEKSRNELLQLVFHPGLSTAEKVTQLSGRGVGMDVVVTVVRKLSGQAWVDSDPGKGTITELKIPMA